MPRSKRRNSRAKSSYKMPGIMAGQYAFSRVPTAEIPRSRFDRSFGYKTTFDAGLLVPVYLDEALPGDTFSLSMSAFARLATPLKPLMDNLYLDSFFFAVPYRLVWDNWEKFNGAQDDPGDSTDFTIPIMGTITPTALSIHDYFGIPVGVSVAGCSSLWHRAYFRIWNEWFRDQNIQPSHNLGELTGDGPDTITAGQTLRPRNKRHDYFTSCLPWPQKGDSVSLPLGTAAPVASDASTLTAVGVYRPAPDDDYVEIQTLGGVGDPVHMSNTASSLANRLYADLSTATAATINQLRQAFQTQKLLERDARGGTRYTEVIKSHFGVTSPDARLQRTEYLGGGSTPILVSAVPQTSATDAAVTPQGNLAAYATAAISQHGFTKSFTEHCLLIGLVSVRADLTYQQGLDRMFSRSTRFDFYWPALAHIGEQAVLSKEIFMSGVAGPADDDSVFGYQERYAEYRYKPSKITGQFRSNHATTLDIWHLSQEFGSRPTLDTTFIPETPPIDRVVAVPTEPDFLFDSFFRLTCARPMPVFGVPGLIDHF